MAKNPDRLEKLSGWGTDMESPVCHIVGGTGFHFGQKAAELFNFLRGQGAGDAAFPALEDLGELGKQFQRLFCGVKLHDTLIRAGGLADDEAFLFQNYGMAGNIALVDADALGELVLGNAGGGADFRELAGVDGFQPHGRQTVNAVLHTAAGNLNNVTDDLGHGIPSFGQFRIIQFYHGGVAV